MLGCPSHPRKAIPHGKLRHPPAPLDPPAPLPPPLRSDAPACGLRPSAGRAGFLRRRARAGKVRRQRGDRPGARPRDGRDPAARRRVGDHPGRDRRGPLGRHAAPRRRARGLEAADAARAGRGAPLVALPSAAAEGLAWSLPRYRRGSRDGLHAVRARGCAARVPLLRRARLQGDLRDLRHRAGGPAGALERPARRRRGRGRRQEALAFRPHAADLDLPGGAGRRRPGPRRRRLWRSPGARLGAPREARARQAGARDGLRLPAAARRLLRPAVPVPEARPGRRPRLRGGRDGERGRAVLPRVAAAARSREGDPRGHPARGDRGGARDGAPVVRRPRHHGVVGRPLAQRGLRHLDGVRDRRPVEARVAPLDRLRAHEGPPAAPGLLAFDAAHPGRGEDAGAGQRDVRRHHLQQGRGGAAHVRGVAGERPLQAGRAGLSRRPPVGQRQGGASLGSAGAGHREAGRGAGAQLVHARGLSAAERRAARRDAAVAAAPLLRETGGGRCERSLARAAGGEARQR